MNQNEYLGRFADLSIDELIDLFNQQAGRTHWVAARGRYLEALRQEFLSRDIDCSSIITGSSICIRKPIRLEGNRILQDPTIDVYREREDVPEEKTVVIGRVPSNDEGDCFVACLHSEAIDNACLHEAIKSSQTWNEFRRSVGVCLWHSIRVLFEDNEQACPVDEAAFDAMEIPGYADGDWPVCPRTRALQWLPLAAIEAGQRFDTSTGGELIEFDSVAVPTLLRELENAGFLVIRSDEIVWKACGIENS